MWGGIARGVVNGGEGEIDGAFAARRVFALYSIRTQLLLHLTTRLCGGRATLDHLGLAQSNRSIHTNW